MAPGRADPPESADAQTRVVAMGDNRGGAEAGDAGLPAGMFDAKAGVHDLPGARAFESIALTCDATTDGRGHRGFRRSMERERWLRARWPGRCRAARCGETTRV